MKCHALFDNVDGCELADGHAGAHCCGDLLWFDRPLGAAKAIGWQPIETAPKDGTWVLVGGVGHHWVGVAYCSKAYSQRWFTITGDELPRQPTHWMPLPEPPK